MFDRGLWTPDEPREADIAWRMSGQTQHVIPELAGVAFLEKPPLSYWLAAASISKFGASPAGARLPNLLYAAVTAVAIGTLGFAMDGACTAIVAALLAGSALIVYRAAIWLAPDAALLAGSAVALLGAYWGYTSPAGFRKLLGYTVMHVGAAFGFMAKSAPGWLVPALALATLIVWERRFSELRCWELYAGGVLQALLIGPWILAVAHTPDGGESLRALFWENLVGRFTPVSASPGHDYAQGHVNWWGKYLVELPVYLLPWTVLTAAALRRAWQEVRVTPAAVAGVTAATPWRFALSASLPFLGLLSLAATSRDIYSAPAIFGFALLIALWSKSLQRHASYFDELSLRATRVLVAIIACILAILLGIFAAAEHHLAGRAINLIVAVAVIPISIVGLRFAARLQRARKYRASIVATYAVYGAALTLSAMLIFPAIDRWQDLGALARRIQSDSSPGGLAVLNPDETTIAMLDFRLRTTFTTLSAPPADAAQIVAHWFDAHGSQVQVLVMMPGHAGGDITALLGRWYRFEAPGDGLAGTLQASGIADIKERYELPQGRRYALLAASPR
jgi:4-amino-4-deoxy-L-arabinose transferase-like glycosyltransferase